MAITSTQVRMARAALKWTVRDLAGAANVHPNTISNIETGRYAGDAKTLSAIERALTQVGIEFIGKNGDGVRLRRGASSPKLILNVSRSQVKAARALLGWSQEALAREAGLSVPTVKRLEAGEGVLGGRAETGRRIRATIEAAGVEFIHQKDDGPGVRLGKRRRTGRS
jgi:transcriptional regulator with XRE-family HTH domain